MKEIKIETATKEELYEVYKQQAQEFLVQEEVWKNSDSFDNALANYDILQKKMVLTRDTTSYEEKNNQNKYLK